MPSEHGVGAGQVRVNPADLNNAAEQYAQLQMAAAAIGPQAVDEVQRIIASHGAIGYPVAVGVVTGLARRQAQVEGKAADFGLYAERLNEHAATYLDQDRAGARGYGETAQFTSMRSQSDPWDWDGETEEYEPIDPGGAAPGPGVGPAIPPTLI
ncbi:type VII secretion target [Mycolicibacterium neoaurum]|uniref:type VII secretion target n=1 Tax=Mycolicibacterium neoaurum TaxID=1795 RepID=UPI001F4C735C|nr:type VII secretion target [Mycolicibacterium neoaurum]